MGRIVVFGSLNTDLVVTLPHLPGRGETVIGDRLHMFPGGKGANQAVAASRLGGNVAMVGRVGRDAFGETLLQALRADGVETSAVERDATEPTGVALILVERGGQNMIAVAPGANGSVGEADVQRALARLDRGGLLVLQLEIPITAVESAMRGARSKEAAVLLNAAPARELPGGLLRGLDVLVVNEVEAEALFRCPVRVPDQAEDAGRAALEAGVKVAIITLGAAGAVLCQACGVTRLDPFPVDAVDATAAGDAFVGALAVALARGVDPTVAGRLAAAAAAAATTRYGAQNSLPRPDDLLRLFGIVWGQET
jgi:ribokinase